MPAKAFPQCLRIVPALSQSSRSRAAQIGPDMAMDQNLLKQVRGEERPNHITVLAIFSIYFGVILGTLVSTNRHISVDMVCR